MARKALYLSITLLLLSQLSCGVFADLALPGSERAGPPAEASAATIAALAECRGEVCRGQLANSYYVMNPKSGARLFTQIVHPANWNQEPLETLIVAPGGLGTLDLRQARQMADEGFTVVVFDPDGRGQSEGQEDLGGFTQQDGLAAVIRAAADFPGVDASRIGLVAFSHGITMASGALARYPDLPIQFLIDWEGPADRMDTTLGCEPEPNKIWPACEDDQAWLEREAKTFIKRVQVPYQRLQSQRVHAQPGPDPAVKLVNAALQSSSPLVRLNNSVIEAAIDSTYPPEMLPAKAQSAPELLISRYAHAIFRILGQSRELSF